VSGLHRKHAMRLLRAGVNPPALRPLADAALNEAVRALLVSCCIRAHIFCRCTGKLVMHGADRFTHPIGRRLLGRAEHRGCPRFVLGILELQTHLLVVRVERTGSGLRTLDRTTLPFGQWPAVIAATTASDTD
jgi:hypothetical protein